MILFVSGATATVQANADSPYLGRLIQPENGNDIRTFAECDMDKGADNNCLQGFDLDKWMAMCEGLRGAHRLRFVAAPDAVEMTPEGPRGDWGGTLWLFRRFRPWLAARSLPIAIVAQDGATVDSVPWSQIDALFIGGSTRWKLGRSAALLIRAAAARGKWVHVGRVNSYARVAYLDGLPVNSFDGGQFSMFPDTYIPKYLNRLQYRQKGFHHAT